MIEIEHVTVARRDLRIGRILVETPVFSRICKSFSVRIWSKIYLINALEACCNYGISQGDFASMAGDQPEYEFSEPDEVESDEEFAESHEEQLNINVEGHVIKEGTINETWDGVFDDGTTIEELGMNKENPNVNGGNDEELTLNKFNSGNKNANKDLSEDSRGDLMGDILVHESDVGQIEGGELCQVNKDIVGLMDMGRLEVQMVNLEQSTNIPTSKNSEKAGCDGQIQCVGSLKIVNSDDASVDKLTV